MSDKSVKVRAREIPHELVVYHNMQVWCCDASLPALKGTGGHALV
jgi:hypothetical protein